MGSAAGEGAPLNQQLWRQWLGFGANIMFIIIIGLIVVAGLSVLGAAGMLLYKPQARKIIAGTFSSEDLANNTGGSGGGNMSVSEAQNLLNRYNRAMQVVADHNRAMQQTMAMQAQQNAAMTTAARPAVASVAVTPTAPTVAPAAPAVVTGANATATRTTGKWLNLAPKVTTPSPTAFARPAARSGETRPLVQQPAVDEDADDD